IELESGPQLTPFARPVKPPHAGLEIRARSDGPCRSDPLPVRCRAGAAQHGGGRVDVGEEVLVDLLPQPLYRLLRHGVAASIRNGGGAAAGLLAVGVGLRRRRFRGLRYLAEPVVDALQLREHPGGAVAIPRRGGGGHVGVEEPLDERQEPPPRLLPQPPRQLAPLLRAASPLPLRRRDRRRRHCRSDGSHPPLDLGREQPRLRGRRRLRRRRRSRRLVDEHDGQRGGSNGGWRLEVAVALVSESVTTVARDMAAWRARNCSTAGCGFCSSAVELTSAYELHPDQHNILCSRSFLHSFNSSHLCCIPVLQKLL
ncbi:Os08g0541600, partial [Oryza sativa Japonica Group]